MSKKFGLGKGLNALIPDEVSNNINSKKENNKDGVALIDINLIKNNNEQPRKLFDDEKIIARICRHPMAIWKCSKQP